MMRETRRLGIWMLALALSAAALGCEAEGGDEEPDTALNGTWVSTPDPNVKTLKMDGGAIETSLGGAPEKIGIYRTSNGSLTIKTNKYWGAQLKLDENWYDKDALRDALIAAGKTPDQANETVNEKFAASTKPYSINGITLTIGGGVGKSTYEKLL